jgi:hypothetical protein
MNARSITGASLSEALTGRKAEVLSFIGKAELLQMLRDALDRNAQAEPASLTAFSTFAEATRIERELLSRGVKLEWDGEEIIPEADEWDGSSWDRECSAADRRLRLVREGA